MIKLIDSGEVYAPREDSELMLKAVKFAHGEVLDMCAGSGVIGLNAAAKADHVTLADVSPKAVSLIKKNAKLNNITNYSAVRSDLFKRINGKFDVIYCNPPYLPGKAKEPIEKALYGGPEGSEITIRFIEGLKNHLKPGGKAFLILSTAYDIQKVYKSLKSIGLRFKKLENKRFFFEELILILIYENRRNSLQ